jgi:hypothetical protein
MNTAVTFIGCLMVLVALGLVSLAVIAYQGQTRQREQRVDAQGEVISLVRRRSRKVGEIGVFCPIVKFWTPSGQEIQFESQFGTLPASHKVGQTVPVLYEPANPQNAEISSAMTKWLVPLSFGLMGLIVLSIGSFLLLPRLIMNFVSP